MTHADEVRDAIDSSRPDQWEYFEQVAPHVSVSSDPTTIVYVYDEDVNIRLERGHVAVQNFDEPWVPGAGGRTDSYDWWLTYQNSPVEFFVVVSVDGGRANIPVPEGGHTPGSTPTLTQREAKLGRILSQHSLDTFDNIASRADIEIE